MSDDATLRAAEHLVRETGAQADIDKLKHLRCRIGACCAGHPPRAAFPTPVQVDRMEFTHGAYTVQPLLEVRASLYLCGPVKDVVATIQALSLLGITLPEEVRARSARLSLDSESAPIPPTLPCTHVQGEFLRSGILDEYYRCALCGQEFAP